MTLVGAKGEVVVPGDGRAHDARPALDLVPRRRADAASRRRHRSSTAARRSSRASHAAVASLTLEQRVSGQVVGARGAHHADGRRGLRDRRQAARPDRLPHRGLRDARRPSGARLGRAAASACSAATAPTTLKGLVRPVVPGARVDVQRLVGSTLEDRCDRDASPTTARSRRTFEPDAGHLPCARRAGRRARRRASRRFCGSSPGDPRRRRGVRRRAPARGSGAAPPASRWASSRARRSPRVAAAVERATGVAGRCLAPEARRLRRRDALARRGIRARPGCRLRRAARRRAPPRVRADRPARCETVVPEQDRAFDFWPEFRRRSPVLRRDHRLRDRRRASRAREPHRRRTHASSAAPAHRHSRATGRSSPAMIAAADEQRRSGSRASAFRLAAPDRQGRPRRPARSRSRPRRRRSAGPSTTARA